MVAKADNGGTLLEHGGHLHLHCIARPLALGDGEVNPVSPLLCVVHRAIPPTLWEVEKLVSSEGVIRGADLGSPHRDNEEVSDKIR